MNDYERIEKIIRYGIHPSPFGMCLIGATNRGICHLSFLNNPNQKSAVKELHSHWPNATLTHAPHSTGKMISRIFNSFSKKDGAIRAFLVGSPFQLKVWEALVRIPPGVVASYGDIARAIGKPGSSRAVGTALASNHVAYLIPCHRVIRETGVFGQYRWGSLRKRAILAWERQSNGASSR